MSKSNDNAEIVKLAAKAFNDVGMAEAARRFFHEDGVFEEPPEQPSPSVAVGRDAAVQMAGQFDEMWEEHRSEVEELRVVDDERVLLFTIEHFRGRDGLEITQPSGSIYTLRDGQIIRLQVFWERETALGAAGLSE